MTNWTYNDLPTTNAEVREELRIKTLLAPYVEPLMERIVSLQNENQLLYHQRDEWMQRAKDPQCTCKRCGKCRLDPRPANACHCEI